MTKWILIKPYENSPIQIWEYIDDVKEAMKYPYVKAAIKEYGEENVMPIAMNDLGGYHTHRPNRDDVVCIIESHKKPNISVFKQYPINHKEFKTGWVSPDCTTFSCNYMGHLELAARIVNELYGNYADYIADDVLLECGWMKVSNKQAVFDWYKITDRQAEFLKDHGISTIYGGLEK